MCQSVCVVLYVYTFGMKFTMGTQKKGSAKRTHKHHSMIVIDGRAAVLKPEYYMI